MAYSNIQPANLSQGDKIGILSTARKISSQELAPAIEKIKAFGFKAIIGENIDKEDHQFAGSEELRAQSFNSFLRDNSIKAILCARGGYGSGQLLDKIDFDMLKENPKWIIGYSDITALHLHLNSNVKVQSLHASMPINFATNTPEALSSLFSTIQGEKQTYHFPNHPFNKQGNVTGELIGGNLSVIYSLQGTLAAIDCKDKILFLEDLDEYLYHIDRIMLNLKLSGKLEHLSGLIIGGMTDMNDNTIPFGKTAIEIIRDYCEPYTFPIAYNFPAGHLDDNRALIMGGEVELNISNSESTLKFL